MRTSFRIGRIGQTEIRLHLSLILILPYVFFQFRPESVGEMAWSLSLLVVLFLCILLHEIGHTLVARRSGIRVNSIVLWPLGGIATLERQPEKPGDALLIALAGPLVNLVLGVGLLLWAYALRYGELVFAPVLFFTGVWHVAAVRFPLALGFSNLILALFNLAPIYPLDGGQITRAGLQLLVGRQRADQLTLFIAVPLATALALFGLRQRDFLLVLISLLLVLGASSLNARLLRHIYTGYAALAQRGSYYQLRGDYDRAAWHFSRAIARHPKRAALYAGRAVAFIYLQQFDRAREDVERALLVDPDYLLAVLLRAELYLLEGCYDQALEWCERARQVRPDWFFVHADMGETHLLQGDLDKALPALDRAIELNPRYYLSYILRAIARYLSGDREGSREDQAKALDLSQKEALVYPEFIIPTVASHLDWALEYYNWAEQRLPRSPHPYQGRADVLRANGDWERAVLDYSEAIRLAPKKAELFLGRGLAHQGAGDAKLAAADFRRAGQLGKKAHLRRRSSELLQEIEPG